VVDLAANHRRPGSRDLVADTALPGLPVGLLGGDELGGDRGGALFPDVADEMSDRAWEAAASRGWAGIHYVLDDDIALAMGRQVGRLVCALPGANEVEGV
jgi:hypothetical protein